MQMDRWRDETSRLQESRSRAHCLIVILPFVAVYARTNWARCIEHLTSTITEKSRRFPLKSARVAEPRGQHSSLDGSLITVDTVLIEPANEISSRGYEVSIHYVSDAMREILFELTQWSARYFSCCRWF